MRPFRNRRGFTFIELVLVLAVSSILVSVAIVRIAPTLERARVRRSASKIATDLQYAQMIAARQRRPVVFIASEPLRGYMIRDAASTTVYREAYLGNDTDFNLDQLEANPTTLEIFPNGVVRTAGSYTVRVNTVQRNVRITRAGQVRITSVP
jgi:prepilin-type N-terminal cleavage/methylation domain-containing protein